MLKSYISICASSVEINMLYKIAFIVRVTLVKPTEQNVSHCYHRGNMTKT